MKSYDKSLLFDIIQFIEESIGREEHISHSMDAVLKNAVRGAGIVLVFAWLESNFKNTSWKKLRKRPFAYAYWEEIINAKEIRDCFAHYGDGRMFLHKKKGIANFRKEFDKKDSKLINFHKGKVRKPYYDISKFKIKRKNRVVILLNETSVHWFVNICYDFRKALKKQKLAT